MEYQIDEQEKWFYVTKSNVGYKKVVGNEIKIGKYHLCAIPMNDPEHGTIVSITEATSGYRLDHLPINQQMEDAAATKAGYLGILVLAAKFAAKMIEHLGEEKIDKRLSEIKEENTEKFGLMPAIEDKEVDIKTLEEPLW